MINFKLIVWTFSVFSILAACDPDRKSAADTSSAEKTDTVVPIGFVRIGKQLWADKNLGVATFRNGDPVPEAKTNTDWTKACGAGQPACCYFENDPKNDSVYGRLYNWYAVNDPRGLAPAGEHVASNEEWAQLIDFMGGQSVAGKKMKSKQGWEYDGNGTNEYGFSVAPAGERHADGEFSSLGLLTAWWTSSPYSDKYVWEYYMYHFSVDIKSGYISKNGGFSVRCIKDEPGK